MSFKAKCEDKPDNTIPEDTIVRAKLTDIILKEIEYVKNGETKSFEKLYWTFQVADGGPEGTWVGKQVRGQTDPELTNEPHNKFRNWSEALLNRDIAVGFQLDTDDLIGMTCKITVKHEEDRRDSNKIWERVDEVLPAGGFNDAPPF
jgi:hypothetical protein